ncbi:MAG: alpha/beta hydrolase [Lachnospiraceae bacterium]|nr:alpha/beta hydrolase [Lachnospiraceae bacterium]
MAKTNKKKGHTVLSVIGIFFLTLIIVTAVILIRNGRRGAEDQVAMVKTDEELIGEHFYIKRDGKEDIDINFYIPESAEKTPVVINLHGGAFIAGDADTLDTQSDRISKEWNAAVVTVNYKLAKNGISIQYAVDEVVDTVKYFKEHAGEYNIDPEKIVILGYSAGGYHAMASTLELRKQGIDVAAQVICYGFIKEVVDTYYAMTDEQRKTTAPALFILADHDPISDGSLKYEEALRENGVITDIKKYDGSMHGFIEENNPEYEKLHSKASKSPEQEIMARDAEAYIGDWIKMICSNE